MLQMCSEQTEIILIVPPAYREKTVTVIKNILFFFCFLSHALPTILRILILQSLKSPGSLRCDEKLCGMGMSRINYK